MIFARNMEIGLDFQSPANMAVAAQGISQKAMLQVSKAPVSIKHMTNLRSVAQPVTQAKAVNIRDFVAKSAPDKSGNRSFRKVGELSSAISDFPVPPVFRCQPILEKIATELRGEQDELLRLVTENKALLDGIGRLEESIRQDEARINRYPPEMKKVEVRNHSGGKTTTQVIDLQAIRNQINAAKGELARKQAEQARMAEAIRTQSGLIEDLRGTQAHFQFISTSRFTS